MPDPYYKFINVHYFPSLIKLLKETLDIDTDRESLERLYKENHCISMLAINAKKVIGHILVETRYDFINNRRYYVLSHMCIKEEYRKFGIGTAMIKRLETYAKNKKITYFEAIPGNVPTRTLRFLDFNHFYKKKDQVYYKNLH